MKESMAAQEVEKDVAEVRGEVAELTLEFPKEMAVCPMCGSHAHLDAVHKSAESSAEAEVNKDIEEVVEAIQALKAKYPAAIAYCPICGSSL